MMLDYGFWFLKDIYKQLSMYEVGRFFLQHKFVVRRNKKRGRK